MVLTENSLYVQHNILQKCENVRLHLSENTLHFRGSGANGNRQMSCATEGRHAKGGEKRNHPTNKQQKRIYALEVTNLRDSQSLVVSGAKRSYKVHLSTYRLISYTYLHFYIYLYLHLLYLFVQAVN